MDRYARRVLGDGEAGALIVAGPLVRLACARHLRDRTESDVWWFSEEAADVAIEFFETVLRLPDVLDDNGEPRPFLLHHPLDFIIGSIMGWMRPEGYRRFREAYIEMGKGNGKTPMLAGLGLFGLTMTTQPAPEIYSAGTVREQSLIMFRDACRMVDVSPGMQEFHVKKSVNNLSCGMGFFRPYSRDQGQKSGWRPYFALIDEVHEHTSADAINKLVAGFKEKLDPLAVEITNSGFDRTSICWQHHLRAERMLEQTITDDHLFAFVCDLDPGDDPVNDESCWPKTNPLLDKVVTREYLRRQVQNMKNVPASYNENMRLNFCVWTQQDYRAINMTNWRACKPMPPESALLGMPCFGAFDLGMHDDFTAWVLMWLLEDGRVVVRSKFWIPEKAVETYPNRPYSQWKRQGILNTTEGSTTYYAVVEQAILEDCRHYGVREVAYDKRFAEQMAQNLQGAGVNLTNQAQGFDLNEACRRLQELLTTGDLCHGGDEILGWMASNYVEIHGNRGDVRPDKERAGEKVDGIVALEMALMCAIRAPKPAEVSIFFLPRR